METRHLGVYGVIIVDNKILLVRKSRGAYIGKLDLPGGSIEHGETPVETLRREIKEETNLDIEKYSILCADSVLVDWKDNGVDLNMHHIGIMYDVEVGDNSKIKQDSDGLDSLGADWYNISDLEEDEISPLTAKMLKLKRYR